MNFNQSMNPILTPPVLRLDGAIDTASGAADLAYTDPVNRELNSSRRVQWMLQTLAGTRLLALEVPDASDPSGANVRHLLNRPVCV